MKKKLLLLFILFIPFIVKAEDPITLTYELCKSGCEYSDINTIYNELKTKDNTKVYNITINIKDGETYGQTTYVDFSTYTESYYSTLTIKGTGNTRPTIDTSTTENGFMSMMSVINYENINFNSSQKITYHSENITPPRKSDSEFHFKNVNFNAEKIGIITKKLYFDNVNVNTNLLDSNNYGGTTVIKNSNITGNEGTFVSTVFFHGQITIENSKTTHIDVRVEDLIMSNTTINGNINARGNQKYTKSIIEGYVSIDGHAFDIEETEITKGLVVDQLYCPGDTNTSIGEENTIKNSKISNPNGYAITQRIREKMLIKIDNTDLDNSYCSIYMSKHPVSSCTYGNLNQDKFKPMFLNNLYDEVWFEVSNSKINCAITTTENISIPASDMYFDYTNTWTRPIIRSSEVEDDGEAHVIGGEINVEEANVIEWGGKIYIELGSEGTLYLNVDKEKDIHEYFKDIVPKGSVLGEWIIEDESIIKIVDGKVIPLKVGTTKISAVIDNNVYSVFLTVEESKIEDTQNPNTGNLMNVIIVIIILSIISVIILIKNAKEIKEY